jgi:hypothetical protein
MSEHDTETRDTNDENENENTTLVAGPQQNQNSPQAPPTPSSVPPTSPEDNLTEKIFSILSLQYALMILVIGGSLTLASVISTVDVPVSSLVTCDIESVQQHTEEFNTFLALTSIIIFFLVCCVPCNIGAISEKFL